MAVYRISQVIRRPVDVVFKTVIHIEQFPDWNPGRNPSARRLSGGEIANGALFELEIKGFGTVQQELQEFEINKSVRVVPHIKPFHGGHRFLFTDLRDGTTRIDHDIEMIPNGWFRLMLPVMMLTGISNLRATMRALQRHLDGSRDIVAPDSERR